MQSGNITAFAYYLLRLSFLPLFSSAGSRHLHHPAHTRLSLVKNHATHTLKPVKRTNTVGMYVVHCLVLDNPSIIYFDSNRIVAAITLRGPSTTEARRVYLYVLPEMGTTARGTYHI
jgi:hypothetical protein